MKPKAEICWVKKGNLLPVSPLIEFCLSFSNGDFIDAYNKALEIIKENEVKLDYAYIERYRSDRSLYEWYKVKYINEILVPLNEEFKKKEIEIKAILLGGAMCYLVGEVDGKYQCYHRPKG